MRIVILATFFIMATTSAQAQIITVQTAAGIPITIASHLAAQFQGFIIDLVGRGYTPRRIGCYARGGHVRHSRHYSGSACDFDQRGWGKTAMAMHHVSDLAKKHGLRDGKTFRDAGHIDDGGRRYTLR